MGPDMVEAKEKLSRLFSRGVLEFEPDITSTCRRVSGTSAFKRNCYLKRLEPTWPRHSWIDPFRVIGCEKGEPAFGTRYAVQSVQQSRKGDFGLVRTWW